MQNFCERFRPCSVIPPEWHWVMAIAMPLLMIIVVGVPVANILHRAGRSRWWIPKLSLTSLCQTDTST